MQRYDCIKSKLHKNGGWKRPPFFYGICGMQAGAVDASLGIMGNSRGVIV